MKPLIDVIIPTFDNFKQLYECITSIICSLDSVTKHMVRIIVVNNGTIPMSGKLVGHDGLIVVDAGGNLGWEGGLKLGLEHSDAPFVVFCNDDIKMLEGNKEWVFRILCLFNDKTVGAVGPSSNFVMGPQSIFYDTNKSLLDVTYLIGFFFVLRREALDAAGGVDSTLPGGDDIDLSIRLRDAGYRLVCRRDTFVYHHGQQTGARVHQGYWNSSLMQERTNLALIKKHGMMKFWKTIVGGYVAPPEYRIDQPLDDIEGKICRENIIGEKILEVGCGAVKTDPRAIGVDLHECGDHIPFVTENNSNSVADRVGDVSLPLPFEPGSMDTVIARHILEHCQDTLSTLSAWNNVLRIGGRLIVAVPNNNLGNTIIGNPEHIVTFVPSSLINVAAVCGFHPKTEYHSVCGQNILIVFEKVSEPLMRFVVTKTVHSKAATISNEMKKDLVNA